MKVKIYEGRKYTVAKKNEVGGFYTDEIKGYYKNDREFNTCMKARGEKFVGIVTKTPVYKTYEFTNEMVKAHGKIIEE